MCFVEIAQLEHKRHNFGINLGAIPLGSRSLFLKLPSFRKCPTNYWPLGDGDLNAERVQFSVVRESSRRYVTNTSL